MLAPANTPLRANCLIVNVSYGDKLVLKDIVRAWGSRSCPRLQPEPASNDNKHSKIKGSRCRSVNKPVASERTPWWTVTWHGDTFTSVRKTGSPIPERKRNTGNKNIYLYLIRHYCERLFFESRVFIRKCNNHFTIRKCNNHMFRVWLFIETLRYLFGERCHLDQSCIELFSVICCCKVKQN